MRVLVTRPRAQAEATAARLAALGHVALVAPLLEIVRTAERPPRGPFDAVIVTSANAVPALASFDKTAPAFAVGQRTALLLREVGFTDVRSAQGDAAAVAKLASRSLKRDARLLHVAGRDRKLEPAASLVRAGFTVETFVAYEAVAAKAVPETMAIALHGGSLDAALHYSRRTVETALALTGAVGLGESFLSLHHLCLSADVAAPLKERGARRLIVAQTPSEASLFAGLALCRSSGVP